MDITCILYIFDEDNISRRLVKMNRKNTIHQLKISVCDVKYQIIHSCLFSKYLIQKYFLTKMNYLTIKNSTKYQIQMKYP